MSISSLLHPQPDDTEMALLQHGYTYTASQTRTLSSAAYRRVDSEVVIQTIIGSL
jgi:hypothetical protein